MASPRYNEEDKVPAVVMAQPVSKYIEYLGARIQIGAYFLQANIYAKWWKGISFEQDLVFLGSLYMFLLLTTGQQAMMTRK